jgi:hypothetical protein
MQSRLVMQPIRDRASSSRSITMGATASPAIKLRVSLASTKATLPSKRPMAIDAKPSAHVMWKRLAAITPAAAKQMDQRDGILGEDREQGGFLRCLDEVPQPGGPSAHYGRYSQ